MKVCKWKSCHAVRIAAGLMAAALLTGQMQSYAAVYNGSDLVSNNIHDHVYSSTSEVSNSYLIDNGNGTFSRLENMGDILLLETYNSSFQRIRKATISMELGKFGGVYSCADGNYILFGQDNPEKNGGLETMRMVRYSKDWNRISSAGIVNTNTFTAFAGGNLDFAAYGDMIYVRGSQTGYDGKQGNFTLAYSKSANRITDVSAQINPAQGVYEGTAAQYISADGGQLTAADARLYSPYAVTVTRYGAAAGQSSFRSQTANVQCLGSAGAINGANTYFTVGGYEVSSQYYLVAGTTTPLDGSAANRNVYLAAVPKGNFASSQILISYMTGYAAGATLSCETPFLVKISADRFMVLWETRNGMSDQETVNYVLVNEKGGKVSDIGQISGCLSDCQPVLFGGNVIWYTTNGKNMKLYAVPVSAGAARTQPASSAAAVYKGVDYSKVYDFSYYCNRYPDIRVLFGNDPAAALAHFVNSGMAEGRQASENFNVTVYRKNYADLQNAFGDNLKAYYLHFINHGSLENRNARTYK